MYDYAIVIGRFQPFHNGHKSLIDHALGLAGRVAVILGSEQTHRTDRNPWLIPERRKMIRSVYPNGQRVVLGSVKDTPGNDSLWAMDVENEVHRCLPKVKDEKFALVTSSKEKGWVEQLGQLFNAWNVVPMPLAYEHNATQIRNAFFIKEEEPNDFPCPKEVRDYLAYFRATRYYLEALTATNIEDAECLKVQAM